MTPSPRPRPTTQVQNVVKILGLRFGTKYTAENIKTLCYGHLMIMTDQDHDGYRKRRPYDRAAAHATSRCRPRDGVAAPSTRRAPSTHRSRFLEMPSPRRPPPRAVDAPRAAPTQVPHQGLTDQLPPPLLALAPRDSRLPAVLHHAHRQGDVEQQKRPLEDVLHCIDTASVDTSRVDACPTQVPEYEAWKDSIGSNASKFSVKYYKGLGTSTAAEARDYFSDLATHQLDFDLLREGDGDLVDMAFSKKRVEDRKTWLRSLEPGAFVDYGVDALAYKVSDSASFPNVSELQVASTASSRCRTAPTPST